MSGGCIRNTSFSSLFMSGPNKLECFSLADLSGLVKCSWVRPKPTCKHSTRLEWPARDKHSSLMGQFVSYEENKVSWIRLLGLYSQHYIFFVTYESAQ